MHGAMISLNSMVMRPMTIMNRRSTGETCPTSQPLAEELPHFEADDGTLTKAQLSQVKKTAPKAIGGTLRSSLFDMKKTQRSVSSTGTSGTIDKNCSKSARRPCAASAFK